LEISFGSSGMRQSERIVLQGQRYLTWFSLEAFVSDMIHSWRDCNLDHLHLIRVCSLGLDSAHSNDSRQSFD